MTEEDSPDLSDSDIATALPCASALELASKIHTLVCSTCQAKVAVTAHARRVRLPHTYWRVALVCRNGHHENRHFQADWVNGVAG
jgi:RNase P subunit RPR2